MLTQRDVHWPPQSAGTLVVVEDRVEAGSRPVKKEFVPLVIIVPDAGRDEGEEMMGKRWEERFKCLKSNLVNLV